MGDRGNIKIKEHTGTSLYVYTHWSGSDLPELLQDALRFAKPRWDDETYLQRCLVTKICERADQDVAGWGLSTYRTDNEHDVLEVDCEQQLVRLLSSDRWHDDDRAWEKHLNVLGQWTFEHYCALSLEGGFESLMPREAKETT